MTPLSLIRLALRDAGVNGQGQTPNDEDVNDAFAHLNLMVEEWNLNRWLIYHLRDVWCESNGNATYLMGAGLNFPVPRATNIEAAFCRFIFSYSGAALGEPIGGLGIGLGQLGQESQGSDQYLTVLKSREDFNRAKTKGILPTPYYVFYDADFPVGKVHFYPVPQAGMYELHLTVKAVLQQFPDLTTDILLPEGYTSALLYNLGVRLRLSYQMPEDPKLSKLASGTINLISGANTTIPNLMMPGSLPSRGRRFNIYSGTNA